MFGRAMLLGVLGGCAASVAATHSFVAGPRVERLVDVPVAAIDAPLPSYESDADTTRLPPASSAEWIRARERDAGWKPPDLADAMRSASGARDVELR